MEGFYKYWKKQADDLTEIRAKLSMRNDTIQIRNAQFYLPNYPFDLISKCMVHSANYWDFGALQILDKYIDKNAVIVDAGANIGNHSIYWAIERKAKKIYAYEPVESTFSILKENVELNKLQNTIEIFNFGLSDETTNASIVNYNIGNVGGTSLSKNPDGIFKLVPLDSLAIEEKIDFIKIDVEGAEIEALKGMAKTIEKNKPVITIESFNKKAQIDEFLGGFGYKMVEAIRPETDFIYKAD